MSNPHVVEERLSDGSLVFNVHFPMVDGSDHPQTPQQWLVLACMDEAHADRLANELSNVCWIQMDEKVAA